MTDWEKGTVKVTNESSKQRIYEERYMDGLRVHVDVHDRPSTEVVFDFYLDRGLGFFRVFGWGAHWKSLRHHRESPSDRNRTFVQLRVGRWIIAPLKRGDYGFRRSTRRTAGA